jgi:hypothetical protein
MEEFKPRYSKEEIPPEKAYEIAEESLRNIQEIVREELKSGKKPVVPKNIEDIINKAIDNVINKSEENILIGVLPQYREETRIFLIQALEKLAKELKRQNLLDVSIFTDELKLSLLAEMLIINREYIAHLITNKLPLPQSIIEKANYIATYQDYEFIDNFINKDDLIAQQLNITLEEAQELFPKWLRLRFAVGNISNPLDALQRVKQHLDTTLTDENIAQQLNITLEEAQQLFSKGLRLYFTINNISNPLEALKNWLEGKISTPYDYKRDEILERLRKEQ